MSNAVTASPFFGIVLSLFAFLFGKWLQQKTQSVLCNPLLIALMICVPILLIFKIPLEDYNVGGSIINMLLAPATAVLAVDIYAQRAVLKQYFVPVLIGCTVGSLTSVAGVTVLCHLFKLDAAITAAIQPKSVTTAIAISIAQSHGGLVPITAVAVCITGLIGVLLAPILAKLFRVDNPVVEGLSIGACSHALGTSSALELGEVQGAMSSIALCMCGLITVVIALFL